MNVQNYSSLEIPDNIATAVKLSSAEQRQQVFDFRERMLAHRRILAPVTIPHKLNRKIVGNATHERTTAAGLFGFGNSVVAV